MKQTATSGNLQITLGDPGMTALHRVGLAGLWMTLEAIDERHPDVAAALHAQGDWSRHDDGVTFRWAGDGKSFFDTLIRESFRLTEDGRIWLLGLGHPDDQGDGGMLLQEAMLGTFLQHGRTRDADSPAKPTGVLVEEVDGQQFRLSYRKLYSYAQQTAGELFSATRPTTVVGWQLPGGGSRHYAFKNDTGLDESPGEWLSLLFAPVGAIYFRVRQWGESRRPQFCLALPDVASLAGYARVRRLFLRRSVRDLVVAGAADAALRVLADLEANDLLRVLDRQGVAAGCEVIAFAVVPWASQQKTRVDVRRTELPSIEPLRFYRLAAQSLPVLPRFPKPGTPATSTGPPVWEISPVLDLVAENIADGRPWWQGFTRLMTDANTLKQLRSHLTLLRRAHPHQTIGVTAMVQDPNAFDDTAARAIVMACHEAWRRRMGALAQRARERGESFGSLVDRERERLRTQFIHCKNAATLRAALTDFWSRAGGTLPSLEDHWQLILPYLTEARWALARDLALLALVSYRAPEEVEDEDTTEADSVEASA